MGLEAVLTLFLLLQYSSLLAMDEIETVIYDCRIMKIRSLL
jgi:hypothetical protein